MNAEINILQLISSTGYYGAERWVVAFANGLDSDKVSCRLAVMIEHDDVHLEILEHFPFGKSSSHKIRMHGKFDLSAVRSLVRLIKAQSIHVIHSHGYKSDLLGLLAARIAGIKCVSTPHGYGSNLDWKIRTYFVFGRFILRFFDKVVPLSIDLKKQLLKSGVSENRISIVNNAVDLDAVDIVLTTATSTTSYRLQKFGYIGRLVSGKQIDHIITIFSKLLKGNAELELHIFGEGPDQVKLEQLARKLSCDKHIFFNGFVSNGLQAINSIDIVLMTSDSEGIPRSIMESLALGKPVVAYDIPGVAELIEHRVTGMLAPLNDQIVFLRCCQEILDDPDAALIFGVNGRLRIENQFAARHMAKQYVQIFRTLLASEKLRK